MRWGWERAEKQNNKKKMQNKIGEKKYKYVNNHINL